MAEPHDIIARNHFSNSEERVTMVRTSMRVPTESNSAYKKRLITAMLEGPVFQETSPPLASWTRPWSPLLVCAVFGLTVLSGLTMFLFLCHHDAVASSSAGTAALLQRKETTPRVASEPGAATSTDDASRALASGLAVTRPASLDREVPPGIPVEFKLKRSRTYQTIGPVGLRLVRINVRRHTCDLSMQLNRHRMIQKRFQLNKPVQLRPAMSSEPLQLSISSINRDWIAGSLYTLPVYSSSAKE